MGWYANQKERSQGAQGLGPKAKPVIVRTVQGDIAAGKLIEKMLARGYELDQQATRGLVGRKHTLTFIRRETP